MDIDIEGSSLQKLAAAEATALRLLSAVPAEKPATPIGFSATSDIELSADN
ncbi:MULTISPECIES: hypothetical protein [unclassified Streptomyces]|uniref:hypothetical protein n=1 Tax=unclassified Streptomyces TaxID=2593676 RepID=UPI0015E16629|nr:MULTISPECIES: hypothetical protein [unclassified Streptomyces]